MKNVSSPNENCKGCYYWQNAFQFCNYPFKERKIGLRMGIDIGSHECTAYGNKFYKPKIKKMDYGNI